MPYFLPASKHPIDVRFLSFYHLQEKSDAKYMFLITIKDIKAGDELTANYNLYTYPKTGIGIQAF